MFVLFALSYIYVAHGGIPWVESIFNGLKPAVMAVVAAAVIHFFGLSIIIVIFASGAVGLLYRVALIAFA
jgi:chromate transporter